MVATTLSAGDISIIGFNFDDPDELAFVLLKDIGSGTEIKFTDNGWQSSGSFRSTEGIFAWTASTDLTAGTVINPAVSSVAFSASGDQILAYQGDDSNPSFIYGLNSEGSSWQSDATDSNTSALPIGLTNGTSAIALNEIDNAIYTGITSGTQAELLAAIADTANWSGSNSSRQTLPSSSFTVADAGGGSGGDGATVFINEIHYDNDGTDTNEGIEIAGTAGTDLSGWAIELYNGNGGTLYDAIALSGTLADQQNSMGTQFFARSGIQNGAPDGIALVDNTGTVVQFLSYEGTLTATEGTAAGMTSTDIGVSETSSTAVGHSLQLSGTGTTYADFTWASAAASTYDSLNNNQTFGTGSGSNSGPYTPIYDIQGSGLASAYDGQTKTTQGVVVADFQGSSELNGFFIQDATGDGNATTSDGIFIYAPNSIDVNVGDLVEVTGIVDEYYNLTQIGNVSNLSIIGSDSVAATTVNLPVVTADALEQYEGMFVQLPQTLTVSETYNLGRYGEVTLSNGRLFQPTNIHDPHLDSDGDGTSDANEQQAANNLNRIILDDASTVQNSDPIAYPGTGLTASNTLRSGDKVSGVTGVISYGFGQYRIQPTAEPNFVSTNARTNAPADVGGSLKVASFNVLNYFNGDGEGGGFPTSRGADTYEEFQRQRHKIVDGIVKLDADIIGLMEIENDGYGSKSAIQDLVNGLNSAQSNYTYSFVNPGLSQLGSDEIAVGFIYRNTVSAVGSAQTTSSGAFASSNRQPLAQTFQDPITGETFTIAVNHFKSKGGTGTGADADLGDGQGNWNATRVAAANDLIAWLASDPTNSGDSDFLIVGDLNAYAKEDPIAEIQKGVDDQLGTADDYTNLIAQYNMNPYSYVFDGQAGYLDHALASSSLVSQVTGATEWHINADEPRVLDYNTEYKSAGQLTSLYDADPFRASDHDPVLIGLDLN